jgi:ATP-dependent Lon protease
LASTITAPNKDDLYWIHIGQDIVLQMNESNMTTLNTAEDVSEPDEPVEEVPDLKINFYDIFMDKRTKRKLNRLEIDVETHDKKKRKVAQEMSLRDSIIMLDIDLDTKSSLLRKYDNVQQMSESDKNKTMNWLRIVSQIPFGCNRELPLKGNTLEDVTEFLQSVQTTLDNAVHGHDHVKDEISQFIAKCITNPKCKGRVLALCGEKGTGKTKLVKSGIANALGLPFFQINFGGMNDVALLTGHDMTYVGSKPGKIVEMLTKAQCMNPIIYLDEIDKIGDTKRKEIYGFLTHLLDPEQNHDFHDNYLSEIKLDLSKVLFICSFNDASSIDSIALDRMKVIDIPNPTISEKVSICKDYIIPQLCDDIGIVYKRKESSSQRPCTKATISPFPQLNVQVEEDAILHLIKTKLQGESGLRQCRHLFDTILSKLNLDYLTQQQNSIVSVTKDMVDKLISGGSRNEVAMSFMYL